MTILNKTLLAFAVLAGTVALPVSAQQTSTVLDPVGDTFFRHSPAFQDVVSGQMTKTASGDFDLLMVMAGPVPLTPTLPRQGRTEIWWGWNFDLDPTRDPWGTPWDVGSRNSEFLVLITWDGTEFAGTAIDRRPLLDGGDAIVTPITSFSFNGLIVEAHLPFELIGDVPPSFNWAPFTIEWAGPVGSEGVFVVDVAPAVFP